jgi:hypothetical protein
MQANTKNFEKQVKPILGLFSFNATPLAAEPSALDQYKLVDSSLEVVKGYEKGASVVRELQEFTPFVSHNEFINNLYVYPQSVNLR